MPPSEDTNIGQGEVRIGPGVMLPKSALVFSFARSSGPGGQSVNKLNTKAHLHVKLDELAVVLSDQALERFKTLARGRINVRDELVLSSSISRSQRLNRQACLDRLGELILRAKAPVIKRKRRRISKRQQEKRLEGKHKRSITKQSRKRIKDNEN